MRPKNRHGADDELSAFLPKLRLHTVSSVPPWLRHSNDFVERILNYADSACLQQLRE